MGKQKTDILDNMACKNCANLLSIKGKYYCKRFPENFKVNVNTGQRIEEETTYKIVEDLDNSCSYFENNQDKINSIVKINFKKIRDVLEYYTDMREDYYDLVALWIIGTWMHESFNAYPFLFLNAMRGSGKTRILKLIAAMSKEGGIMNSPTEATLFRTTGTLCIDEFEGVMSKDSTSIRELLNAAYKKGTKVKRMRQAKVDGSVRQVVEEFDVYRPISLANIWGMEEVLADRCVTLTLEKSNKKSVIKLIEDFDDNPIIKEITTSFNEIQCSLCRCSYDRNLYTDWNSYIKKLHSILHTTHTNNNYTNYTSPSVELFEIINNANIDGRNLELFFPLFLISKQISKKKLHQVISIAKVIVEERRTEERTESRDVLLLEFVSRQTSTNFKKVSDLAAILKTSLHEDEEETKWINSKWFGRALKRLNLVKDKRRVSDGVEVMLDVEKAKRQMEMFQ